MNKKIKILHLGDIVTREPITFFDIHSRKRHSMDGEVVYIHPKGRFHTVEFCIGGQQVRESFIGVQEQNRR